MTKSKKDITQKIIDLIKGCTISIIGTKKCTGFNRVLVKVDNFESFSKFEKYDNLIKQLICKILDNEYNTVDFKPPKENYSLEYWIWRNYELSKYIFDYRKSAIFEINIKGDFEELVDPTLSNNGEK